MANKLSLPWPNDLKINAGEYSHKGNLQLNKNKTKASINHRISGLDLTLDETQVNAVNITSQSLYTNGQLNQTGKLTVKDIQIPVPISNISANFSLSNLLSDKRAFSLRNVKANILDANVYLKQLQSSIANLKGNSTITFTDLPLNNVLALEQQPSLTGEGVLSGKLPFRFEGAKLWIKNGKITSNGKGYIRYHANQKVQSFAATNTGLGIALKVLEDFHYKLLSIGVTYDPNGDLLLKNNLSGKNPAWQQGQPIDFSINIEENLLQLLKTLQFSDSLNEKIQEKFQKQQ